MANGIIVMDKPAGWTSQDVVSKLRGVFGEQRVGHGGTLDPMATGVLPVFVGRSTRAVQYFESANKEYLARLRLGVVTDTQDITGEILETNPVNLEPGALETVLQQFLGPQEQTPPMFSAIKVNGERLYKLARSGRRVKRKPRSIHIYSITLEPDGGEGDPLLRVQCSKGTYIRTLCHDIGQALGCGGCMSSLRRVAAGRFTLDDSVTMEQVLESPSPEVFLRSPDCLFEALPALHMTPPQAKRCRDGTPVSIDSRPGRYRVYDEDGQFIMVGRVEMGKLLTEKGFFDITT